MIKYTNDPSAKTEFLVGDTVITTKEGMGEIIAVNGQQLTLQHEHGICYA